MTRHGAGTVRARAEFGHRSGAGGSVGRIQSKVKTSVPSAADVSTHNPTPVNPIPVNPIIVIAAIGLVAEAILPWALIWLSDMFLFDIPAWLQWIVFGGPPALSLLAMIVYRASRTWSSLALPAESDVSPKGGHS